MRTIAHISDLHFGRTDPDIVESLARQLDELQPSLVVISGDLTQRARVGQYRAAREFLGRLPRPQLVVPGNHDVPLYDVVRRFFFPLGRYRHYIARDLRPVYRDEEMLVLGINTARSFTFHGGRISSEQLLDLRLKVTDAPPELFKVIVTHHPFMPAPNEPEGDIVQQGPRALDVFEACDVDMVLSGHLHLTYSGDLRDAAATVKRSMISVHAGTATSTRRRGGEPNGFNVITIADPRHVSISVLAWNGARFNETIRTHYVKEDTEWAREE